MLRKITLVWGAVLVLVGLAGFVPGLTTTGSNGAHYLLGLFMVDGVHNFVHLLTGAVALAVASRPDYSRLYFQVFGVVYALVTVLGFFVGSGREVLGLIPVNTADNFLHLAITAVSLYLGFGTKAEGERPSARV